MRKIVTLRKSVNNVVRLMIYTEKNGAFLFGYTEMEDCNAAWDQWYFTEDDAIETGETDYGVELSDWKEIPNPEPFCQHDWIAPVRIVGREQGTPEFGKLERLVNGKWEEFTSL